MSLEWSEENKKDTAGDLDRNYRIDTVPVLVQEYFKMRGRKTFDIVDFHYSAGAFISTIKNGYADCASRIPPSFFKYLDDSGYPEIRSSEDISCRDDNHIYSKENNPGLTEMQIESFNLQKEASIERLSMSYDDLLSKYLFRPKSVKDLYNELLFTYPSELILSSTKPKTIQEVINYCRDTFVDNEEHERFMYNVLYGLSQLYVDKDVHLIQDKNIAELLPHMKDMLRNLK